VGMFRFRFSTTRPPAGYVPGVPRSLWDIPPELNRYAYFFDLSRSILIATGDSEEITRLSFLVIPPVQSFGHDSVPITSDLMALREALTRELKRIDTSFDENRARADLAAALSLWRWLELTGACGEWTVLIFGNGATTPGQRQEIIDDLAGAGNVNLRLRFPYVAVPFRASKVGG
jgi:hypothetical protein